MPSISVCMIAKDEEKYIGNCLRSIKPLADEIIIVLADNCSDNTEHIAKIFNARIIRHKWNNDFSEERNISLKEAKGDWVLVLDADECLAKRDLDEIKKITARKDVMGAFLMQRNYIDDDTRPGFVRNNRSYSEETGKGYFDNPILRLFCNNPKIRFEYKLHETVENCIRELKGTVISTDIPIHHYGFMRGDDAIVMKRDRCMRLGEEQIKAGPDEPRHYYDLALIHMNKNDYAKAEGLFTKARDLQKDYKDVNHNLGVISLLNKDFNKARDFFEADVNCNKGSRSMTNLAVLYLHEKRAKEAYELLKKALNSNPNDSAAMKNLAVIFAGAGKLDAAEVMLNNAAKICPDDSSIFFNLGMTYANQGKKQEAVRSLEKAGSLGYKNKDLLSQMIIRLKA